MSRSTIARLILGKSNVFEKYTQVVSTEMLGGMCGLDQKFQSKLIPVPQDRNLGKKYLGNFASDHPCFNHFESKRTRQKHRYPMICAKHHI